MKLGLFAMPLHPLNRMYIDALQQDRDAFILADRLGFSEAICGEHLTDSLERVTSSLMFIASLANVTEHMKLGCGTINLPNGHPAQFASDLAMLDHMLNGRLIIGISAGALLSDAEVLGTMDRDRGAMFLECIDQILQIWERDPPYDIEGQFWQISTRRTYDPEMGLGILPRPLQRPHPEILCPSLAPDGVGIAKAAARGWSIISSNFLHSNGLILHGKTYSDSYQGDSPKPLENNWRVARKIFVAEDDAVAKRYAKTQEGPYAFMVNALHKKLAKAGRLASIKSSPDQKDREVTAEQALATLVIAGDVNRVVDDILELRDKIGPFGTLHYVHVDWQDGYLARRSMELMANEVLPRINEVLND